MSDLTPASDPSGSGEKQGQQGQQKITSLIVEWLKTGIANITSLKVSNGAEITGDVTISGNVTASSFTGSYAPSGWLPYPAGNYTFPSGVQSLAAGVFTLGAATTAPTFTTSSIRRAFYKDNGNHTIDILIDYNHASTAGAANGSGRYYISMPLGYTLDTNFITISTDVYTTGTSIGSAKLRAIDAGTYFFAEFVLKPISTTLFALTGTYFINGNVAYATIWASTAFGILDADAINCSFIITGIPVV